MIPKCQDISQLTRSLKTETIGTIRWAVIKFAFTWISFATAQTCLLAMKIALNACPFQSQRKLIVTTPLSMLIACNVLDAHWLLSPSVRLPWSDNGNMTSFISCFIELTAKVIGYQFWRWYTGRISGIRSIKSVLCRSRRWNNLRRYDEQSPCSYHFATQRWEFSACIARG